MFHIFHVPQFLTILYSKQLYGVVVGGGNPPFQRYRVRHSQNRIMEDSKALIDVAGILWVYLPLVRHPSYEPSKLDISFLFIAD
jgi:hypothetical protein